MEELHAILVAIGAEISEAQVLESEEFFESGKIYLGERLYKDAAKMFTKSLQANKTNYDALFARDDVARILNQNGYPGPA